MKKYVFLAVVLLSLLFAGCASWTPEQKRAFWYNFNNQMTAAQQQRLQQAQYNYYTRPYKVGNVTYIPAR